MLLGASESCISAAPLCPNHGSRNKLSSSWELPSPGGAGLAPLQELLVLGDLDEDHFAFSARHLVPRLVAPLVASTAAPEADFLVDALVPVLRMDPNRSAIVVYFHAFVTIFSMNNNPALLLLVLDWSRPGVILQHRTCSVGKYVSAINTVRGNRRDLLLASWWQGNVIQEGDLLHRRIPGAAGLLVLAPARLQRLELKRGGCLVLCKSIELVNNRADVQIRTGWEEK
mmetsp:Transcript_111263/g.346838  ORF Transcript_111263/g.346838 Transcript_111263/m.346838 type:complete len:228 (+) Transcript_111263:195-878(+)